MGRAVVESVVGMIWNYSPLPSLPTEVLRPLARSASNAALFTPTSDPALVAFENSISDGNRLYMMSVLFRDCTNQELWDSYLSAVAPVLVSQNIPRTLIRGEGDGVFTEDKVLGLKGRFEVSDDHYHVIKGAGHLPMLEKPAEVLDIVKSLVLAEH